MEMLNKFSEAPNEQEFVIVVIGGPFQSNKSVHIHHLLFFFGESKLRLLAFPSVLFSHILDLLFNPATSVCLSQAMIWISNVICRGLFCVR